MIENTMQKATTHTVKKSVGWTMARNFPAASLIISAGGGLFSPRAISNQAPRKAPAISYGPVDVHQINHKSFFGNGSDLEKFVKYGLIGWGWGGVGLSRENLKLLCAQKAIGQEFF